MATRFTDEQVEEVARAMWNVSPDKDLVLPWDKLEPMDEGLKDEIRTMARAAIRKWLQIS